MESPKLYSGAATVTNVEFTDLRFTDGLTQNEIDSGFMINVCVKPKDANYEETKVEIEYSMRECSGKLAGRKQCQIAIENLKRQNLIDGDDISTITNAIGKDCQIYQKTSQSNKNGTTYVNTYLGGGVQKISSEEVARRIAMLNGNVKKIATTSQSNPFA